MSILQPILIVPDVHAPYHDKRAWQLLLTVGRVLKPHTIITMGDFCDFYAVSRHSKDPSRRERLFGEIEVTNTLLDDLDGLKAKEKTFLGGNHEDRLRRYLEEKAPELFEYIDIPSILRLREREWSYVPYKDDTRIGKVWFTHDVGNAGRYAAFKALDTYQHSIVTGHSHRLSYVVEGNATGERMVSAQFGWLGDITKVDYMYKVAARKYCALGFGIGYLAPTGIVYLTPVPIVNYTACVNGTLYRA